MSDTSRRSRDEGTHTAGAFDIRTLIATLLGIYGVVLVIVGLTSHSAADLAKSDGLNVNLWTGLAMVVASALLVTWAYLRPVIVPDQVETDDEADNG